ncbi:MAG: cytidylate kinase-like family protein [Lachnospiraceae bacterium]|nr:cytidylate kinase-like family protein [Lachnospiraceae bacterium]
MSKIISISREFGSGGREIGFRLAQKLGIPFYDKELITMASEVSNISADLFHANDEVITQKGHPANTYTPINPFSPTYEIPVPDQLFVIQTKIIKQLAQNGPCVIIGRCSDMIIEDACKVFICASMKKRMERLMALENAPSIDTKQMENHIRAIDKKRKEYYQYYTGNEWGKPKNYDICLNSGNLGIEACVEIIANLITKGDSQV